jgi:hypothetical protein
MVIHASRPALYCCQGRIERRSLRRWRQWRSSIDDGQFFDLILTFLDGALNTHQAHQLSSAASLLSNSELLCKPMRAEAGRILCQRSQKLGQEQGFQVLWERGEGQISTVGWAKCRIRGSQGNPTIRSDIGHGPIKIHAVPRGKCWQRWTQGCKSQGYVAKRYQRETKEEMPGSNWKR